jgi:hypothetical protein
METRLGAETEVHSGFKNIGITMSATAPETTVDHVVPILPHRLTEDQRSILVELQRQQNQVIASLRKCGMHYTFQRRMCYYYEDDGGDGAVADDDRDLFSYGTVIILEPANAASRVNLRISLASPEEVMTAAQLNYRVRIRVIDKQSSLDSGVYRGIERCVIDTWDTNDPEGLFDTCTVITTRCTERFEEYLVWITDNVMDLTAWEINRLFGIARNWITQNHEGSCMCVDELPLCSECMWKEEMNENCIMQAREFLAACRLIAKNLDASDNAAGRIVAADVLLRRAIDHFADVPIQ